MPTFPELALALAFFLLLGASPLAYRRARRVQAQAASGDAGFDNFPAPGRVLLDLSEAEYERARDALGPDWEWLDGVKMRFAPDDGEWVDVPLPRTIVVDLREKGIVGIQVDRITSGVLGGQAGLVAHGLQRLLRDACAGGKAEDAEARLDEWYRGRISVRRRPTGRATAAWWRGDES